MRIREKFKNFPAELLERNQWLLASPDKQPYTTDKHGTLILARWQKNPSCFLSFDTVSQLAETYHCDIGFILQETDPYCCIDLDVKDHENWPDRPDLWTTPEEFERYKKIIASFDSYTETSMSGKGVHIWLKGEIGQGCRRDGVEIYSQERFIICTGNAFNIKPIQYNQHLLDALVSDIRRGQAYNTEMEEIEQEISDADLYDMACNAANGDKFQALCNGEWEELGYPTQSEADYALMSMICFYSKSNEQCRRVFRCTELGRREKAIRNDYLNYTIRGIRGRQEIEEAIYADQVEASKKLVEKMQSPVPESNIENSDKEKLKRVVTLAHGGMNWPPGLMGEVARYIYSISPRPVKEVAIATSIGFFAGICGKAWNIPDSGLNLYIILIAQSGVGKEGMHIGISKLSNAVIARQPAAQGFFNFTDMVSGQALRKSIIDSPCFLNIAGEWGRKMKRLANDMDGPMSSLRTTMTDLYQKSAAGTIVGGATYSKSENNIASTTGVAYSMLGEATPDTFYGSLTEAMMEDGFLSRFLLIEYKGDRQPLNKNKSQDVPAQLADRLTQIAHYALTKMAADVTVEVDRTPEAGKMIDEFDRECDYHINSSTEEYWRQMWNRASLKNMRLAALLAVTDNWLNPVIQVHHVEWALEVIRKDVALMSGRIQSGDVGERDSNRIAKVLSVMSDYLNGKYSGKNYHLDENMRRDGVITKSFLSSRIQTSAAFSKHKLGATAALNNTLISMIEFAYIAEIPRIKTKELYNSSAVSYQIINLPQDI